MPKGLYANINARKKKGISRSKKKSTITKKAYANMKAGFPKKKKKKQVFERLLNKFLAWSFQRHANKLFLKSLNENQKAKT